MHDGIKFLRQHRRPPMMIEAIRPEAKQSGPYHPRDIVRTRVRKASSWPLMDTLADSSIRNSIEIYTRLKASA